jgi:hypothetical protein
MQTYKKASAGIIVLTLLAACGGTKPGANNTATGVTSMKEVPAVRLNFRYEGDVPAPQTDQQSAPEERNQAVQGDFDNGRPQDEVLDKTISSPGKQSVLAVWHRAGDADRPIRPRSRLSHAFARSQRQIRCPSPHRRLRTLPRRTLITLRPRVLP